MENKSRIVFKKEIYVVQHGMSYVWCTAASVRTECVLKALEHFKVRSEQELNDKGGTVIYVSTKEIK